MKKFGKLLATVLCAALLVNTAAPLCFAESTIPVDVSDLFKPGAEAGEDSETGKDDEKNDESDKDDDNTDESGKDDGKTDTSDKDDGKTDSSDKDDTDDSGSSTGTSPSRPSSKPRPSTGNSGNSGNSGSTTEKEDSSTETDDKTEDKTETGTDEKTDDTAKTDEAKPTEDEKTPTEPIVYPEFSDVTEGDWFYNDVRELAGMGVINGYPGDIFLPEGNVTRAEFIKLIVTLLCEDQFETDGYVFSDVAPDQWYAKYVSTAFVYGFIVHDDYGDTFEPDEPITRREVAKILINSMNKSQYADYFKSLSRLIGNYQTPYADTADPNIVSLYAMCIMQGSIDDATGDRLFHPDTNISRAETAAVILRVYKWMSDSVAYVEQFKKDNPNAEDLKLLYLPTTASEFYNEFRNAWENSQAFLTYTYPFSAYGAEMELLREQCYSGFILAAEHHPEWGTHVLTEPSAAESEQGGVLRLDFTSSEKAFTYEELCALRTGAKGLAEETAPRIAKGLTQPLEIADAVHDYLVEHVSYDESFSPKGYMAYGALAEGRAVCQGYSGAFNLLCEALGVQSLAVANRTHMWNVVLVDGMLYHYDATYDDDLSAEIYKGIPENEFRNDDRHPAYTLPSPSLFAA